MIVPDKTRSWLGMLFSYRGTAFRRTKGRVAFATLLATVVTVLDLRFGHFHQDLTPLPFNLIGVALGIFLGFRNNTSYDRFWEGRKLWGRLVNTSRSITRQILVLVGPLPQAPGTLPQRTEPLPAEVVDLHRNMVRRVSAYVHALRHHLRDEKDLSELVDRDLVGADEVEKLEEETNPPVAMLQTLGSQLRDAWNRGWVHPLHMSHLEESLTDLTDIQGGCERIKNTPIPFSYTVLIHRIVAVYCYALPFGLVNQVQELTPLVVAIITYSFFGLDAIGDELEEPFGKDANDLPLSALSTMIEINLRERISDTSRPAPVEPDDCGILQ